ncbi:MAG: GntR family transcriptional regulator [Anaerolineae bacterium]|nr:GntR family transcriptional regulator [Anaerolineae bacterium]
MSIRYDCIETDITVGVVYKMLLYLEIAESIRQLIVSGEYKPGDKLPPVRELARHWHCTTGTVSRAYAQLSQEGLVTAHQGSSTRVASGALQAESVAWRWVNIVNQAEKYLLEVLSGGYTPSQAEAALSVAIARWENVQEKNNSQINDPVTTTSDKETLRFAGSHDLMLKSLEQMWQELVQDITLSTDYVGSIGGLIALARNEADIAGAHLWDVATDTYNVPFIEKLLPGRKLVLLPLGYRCMGLIVPQGNPQKLHSLKDLVLPQVIFINRQLGSGNRVWLDEQLKSLNILTEAIKGYRETVSTDLEIARAIVEEKATVGLGTESAASAYGLDFIALKKERYDLVFYAHDWNKPYIQKLVEVVRSEHFRKILLSLGGYDPAITGKEIWVG